MKITLELTAIAPGGDALGRHEGRVIFVPFGIAGEVVEVELLREERSFARGKIVRVMTPAAVRVAPRCQHFGRCGGCDWQHIDYAAQVAYKTEIVRTQLLRIGKLIDPFVLPCIASPQPYGYRNHARLAISPQGKPGYRMEGRHEVLAVAECPILEEALEKRLQAWQGSPADQGKQSAERADWRLAWQTPTIDIGGFDYAVSAHSFFQANSAVTERLLTEVLTTLDLHGGEKVLDLYCGVGLFTVPIAQLAGRVLGVEANAAAVKDARRNLATFAQAQVIEANVEEALTQNPIRNGRWDAVVLDPPRSGMEERALQSLMALKVEKIVYVSCDPATLARDLKRLCEADYRLVKVQPFDMFPQTHHVESLAVLQKKS